jgi:hypothetical protein
VGLRSEERRSVARPEQHCQAGCQVGCRDAVVVQRPRAASLMALRLEQQEPARPDVPAGFRREHLRVPARPSAAAAPKARALRVTEELAAPGAQHSAQAERRVPAARQAAEAVAVREAQQAPQVVAAQPQAAPEVQDVTVVPQPEEPAGAVRRLEVAAVQDVAAAVQRRAAAVPAAVAVRPRGAGVLDAAVRRRAARAAQAVPLSAAAWAALPSTRLQGGPLGPLARARSSAHARRQLRAAQPLAR